MLGRNYYTRAEILHIFQRTSSNNVDDLIRQGRLRSARIEGEHFYSRCDAEKILTQLKQKRRRRR